MPFQPVVSARSTELIIDHVRWNLEADHHRSRRCRSPQEERRRRPHAWRRRYGRHGYVAFSLCAGRIPFWEPAARRDDGPLTTTESGRHRTLRRLLLCPSPIVKVWRRQRALLCKRLACPWPYLARANFCTGLRAATAAAFSGASAISVNFLMSPRVFFRRSAGSSHSAL